MIRAVFDTNLLVSAFLTRNEPGGVSSELLRFVRSRAIQLHLSPEIVAETLSTLIESERARQRYLYTPSMAAQFCDELIATSTAVVNPPPTPGAVPRDPDDDMIIACAAAAAVPYLVSRDRDLLSLGSYQGIQIIPPEEFIHLVRADVARI